MEARYDVIVVGSGLGGLTAASLLAQYYNKRILIIEKHYIVGGQTNEFHRKQFSWEVLLSSIGQMGVGEEARKIMDAVTAGKVEWNALPQHFQRIKYSDLTIDIPNDAIEFQNLLTKLFPNEIEAISQYFRDINQANNEYRQWLNAEKRLDQSPFISQITRTYLDTHFNDEKLKHILSATWADYGVPPEQSSFAAHAFHAHEFLNGGHFPEGGSQKISQAIIEIIKSHGGQVLIGTEATEIILKNQHAVGVKTRSTIGKEAEYFADQVISDVGAETTFSLLLPSTPVDAERAEIANSPHGLSAVILYLGLNANPADFSVEGGDWWIFDSYEPYEAKQATRDILQGTVHQIRLSFPTLRHHTNRPHTMVAKTIVDSAPFQGWHNRPPEYRLAKEVIANGMLDFINKHIPGLEKSVEYYELGTPLTIEHFISKPRGELFGIPVTPSRFTLQSLQPKTPVTNLFLTGNDIAAPGFYGALLGGVTTVKTITGKPEAAKFFDF
jgi:all-trans-retinol 13,14-reductase